jgi:hypothetical protein
LLLSFGYELQVSPKNFLKLNIPLLEGYDSEEFLTFPSSLCVLLFSIIEKLITF